MISTVKIDDGGSDLTDRFKYEVQALSKYTLFRPIIISVVSSSCSTNSYMY